MEQPRLPQLPHLAAQRHSPETLPGLRPALEPLIRTIAIIPVLNEEGAIGPTIATIPRDVVDHIIVVDGGSKDGTVAEAQSAGAEVLIEPRPGYGRACALGAARARELGADIALYMDGDGADPAEEAAQLVIPIRNNEADLVLATRTKGPREPGSMGAHQILAGRAIGAAIGLITGTRYSDMSAFRAIRLDRLDQLGMKEMTYGWNLEMQIRAARARLRIREIPLTYRRRIAGQSKVAGTIRGTWKAGTRIIATFARATFQ